MLGRKFLYAKEIEAFNAVLQVHGAYQSYSHARDVSKWMEEYPDTAEWWFDFLKEQDHAAGN